MNQENFNAVVAETISTINKLIQVKGGEYAGSEDRLANFKRGAELVGVSPLQTLLIYLSKHYDAVSTYVRDEAGGKERVRSEPIAGRFDDIIVYCILAKALIAESKGEPRGDDLLHPAGLCGGVGHAGRSLSDLQATSATR